MAQSEYRYEAGRLAGLEHRQTGQRVAEYRYDYDRNGNRRADTLITAGETRLTSYTLDRDDRLTGIEAPAIVDTCPAIVDTHCLRNESAGPRGITSFLTTNSIPEQSWTPTTYCLAMNRQQASNDGNRGPGFAERVGRLLARQEPKTRLDSVRLPY